MVKFNKKAYDAIVRGRTSLLINNGFFGFLALQLKIVESTDIPTGAVDGVTFYYNPNFVLQLDPREIEFLWAHEVMHCCFKHFARRGSRDPQGWNIAGDYVINLDLQKSGFKLIHNRPINGKNFQCCIDAKYAGMTTEEVYDKLPKITVELIDMIIGEVREPKGGVSPDEAGHRWEKSVRAAIAIAKADNAGNLPSSLKHLIDALDAPKISWRDKTQRFIDQAMGKETSWRKLNRRSWSVGALMPGYAPDRLNKLVCFSDVSGSVSHRMQAEMLGEINGALDQQVADEVIVVYADTQVQHVDEYVTGDVIKAGKYTGGGTAFSNSFKWLRENHPDAACVIYLSDLEVFDFGEDPGIPVLWAVYNSLAFFNSNADRVPFGSCIHVSETT